jgi:hypothetical protein
VNAVQCLQNRLRPGRQCANGWAGPALVWGLGHQIGMLLDMPGAIGVGGSETIVEVKAPEAQNAVYYWARAAQCSLPSAGVGAGAPTAR